MARPRTEKGIGRDPGEEPAMPEAEDRVTMTGTAPSWSHARGGVFELACPGVIALENVTELERTGTLLALTADILRKLARVQAASEREALAGMAETIDEVAEQIAALLHPSDRRQ